MVLFEQPTASLKVRFHDDELADCLARDRVVLIPWLELLFQEINPSVRDGLKARDLEVVFSPGDVVVLAKGLREPETFVERPTSFEGRL